MAGDELGCKLRHPLRGDAALGGLLLGLGVPTRSTVSQHPLGLDSAWCGVTEPYSPMVYFLGFRRSPAGPVLDEEDLAPARVIFRPKPLRSSSHQI
jgi:hypothetical protein